MAGLIADFFRYLWGLLYWNVRKTIFRMRPAYYRCPCQAPSDSGRAMETRCEPAMMWSQPARFHRVCPLLVQTPGGLRCSVDTADVRPFWTRAIIVYLGGTVGIYLLAVLAAFSALRGIGYRVDLGSVAWPPAWTRINVARAHFFMDRGTEALNANNTRVAMSNFATAYELAPLDYDVGFANASLLQLTQPAKSDQIYGRLLLDHPERRDQTADSWHRALLARGDYAQARELARRELIRGDESHSAYWMNSLLFTTAQLADNATLQELLADDSRLKGYWRRVLQTELLVRGTPAERERAVAALRDIWPEGVYPFVAYYQVDRLNRLKQPAAAIALATRYKPAGRLGADEFYRLQLDSIALTGEPRTLLSTIDLLLGIQNRPAAVEMIATHLVKFPNKSALSRTLGQLDAAPLAPGIPSYNALIALFCAAGVTGDTGALDQVEAMLKNTRTTPAPTLAAAREFFLEKPQVRSIASILSALPLPLELTYVLLNRYPLGTAAVVAARPQ